ncbi:MAG TPA: hypothetical protein VMB03_03465 [Bryobacteraceae bacterium]|nr:hypothetical protein [Bryobacteraceae bacterium]
MTLRNILVRAYPRSWREEYGEELGAMLGQRAVSVGVVADVLAGAFRQHLRRDDPWKICGAFLFLWTVAGDLVNCHWFLLLLPPVFFITGAWTVMRDRSDTLSAARAVSKAAILAVLPDVVAVLLAGPNPVQLQDGIICFRWGIYTATILRPEWWEYFPSLARQVLPCIWVGCVGGLFGRLANGVREGLRG